MYFLRKYLVSLIIFILLQVNNLYGHNIAKRFTFPVDDECGEQTVKSGLIRDSDTDVARVRRGEFPWY